MGRVPCCEKDNVKRGQWTPEEDNKLSSYISQHGTRNWRLIPKNAGLQRCGKSCRLRWTNYLRPDLRHGQFTDSEEQTIVKLHSVVGNRWSLIAAQLPGRTDNDVKNYWNTKLKKKLSGMGIDPVTHKPFSHLMAEIATTLAPPQVAHLAEAALGCFKDEMLHLLTKKRVDFQLHTQPQENNNNVNTNYNANAISSYHLEKAQNGGKESTVEKIRLGLSRAIREPDQVMIQNKPWDAIMPHLQLDGLGGSFSGFDFGQSSCGNNGSPWNQSMCSGGSTSTMGDQMGHLKLEENGEEIVGIKEDGNGSSLFMGSECVLWDLPSDDLINPLA